MRIAASLIVLACAALPTTLATVHTQCFNYFMQKDKCVWGAADNRNRCDKNGKPPIIPVGLINPPRKLSKRDHEPLERRYTTPKDTVFPVAGGTGICGTYDTNEPGACLWVGTEQGAGATVETAGWLNSFKTSNCRKQVYIMREGGQPLYVPIVDGCTLNTQSIEVGCFQIAVTTKTFNDLQPTADELARSRLAGRIIWDFDNPGDKPRNGPV